MTYEEMRAELKKRLKPSRYEHSLGVAETAVFLAKRFGVDENKARIAGLLHDCAREYKNEELILEAAKRDIKITPIDRAMPLLLHAYIGAKRISEIYGVYDKEIAAAIYSHTVAGSNMTALDKIIWFADMIEPHRDYPEVGMLRDLAKKSSLNDMMLAGLTQSVLFVTKKGQLIHPNTVIARNELLLEKIALSKEG